MPRWDVNAAAALIPEKLIPTKWVDYDYLALKNITHDAPRGQRKESLNEIFIMLDTETSKSHPDRVTGYDLTGARLWEDNPNYIVKWSIAGNIGGHNLFVIYGSKPGDAVAALTMIHASMAGNYTRVYIHNLAYDWVFLRRWMLEAWGEPEAMLNTKPHYPITIRFACGIELRDSLILSQVSLERWTSDLKVEHAKAVGSWDYDRIRHQSDELTEEELTYIINDVLGGVECLAALRRQLGVSYRKFPLTATGISRDAARELGKPQRAHDKYLKAMGSYKWYKIMRAVFHGGFTHANRHYTGFLLTAEELGGLIQCFDFASSYPFCMIAYRFPVGKFGPLEDKMTVARALEYGKREAVIGLFCAHHIHLKDPDFPFPVLQAAKVEIAHELITDNGRILEAEYVQIWVNDVDLQDIEEIYEWDKDGGWIMHAMAAKQDYLPKWYTDYVYECFHQKTMLKGGDPVAYALSKAKANSNYGMSVQQVVTPEILEDYATGEHYIDYQADEIMAQMYDKEIHKRTKFLPYSIGVYVTAYAMHNVIRLGRMAAEWLYTDTDSVYGAGWDMAAVTSYNEEVKQLLRARGYGPVIRDGREYWLGVAELDGEYTELKYWGAKRYAVRKPDDKIKITVAGVPKATGAACLKSLDEFHPGFIFSGEETGKMTHSYRFVEEITVNEYGDEIGDSINLTPCDYKISSSFLGYLDCLEHYMMEVPDFEDVESSAGSAGS